MKSNNYLMLEGRLTKDLEVRQNESGYTYGRTSIAINDGYRNNNGEWVNRETMFVDVLIPGDKANYLKDTFKKTFGATLRVYKSVSCKGAFADDNATLASIRAEGAKGGEIIVGGNLKVGNFEKKVAELYGIGVQVANSSDTALADNSITLVAAGKK